MDHPEISPVYADLSGLPPIMLEHGAGEVLYDQQSELADKLRAGGIELQHAAEPFMPHVFPLFAVMCDNEDGECLGPMDSLHRMAEYIHSKAPRRSAVAID